ncbi:Uncharacterised protein [Bordetella pertussis]|nr:Uncharacterised protein [Bordetella pertussis]
MRALQPSALPMRAAVLHRTRRSISSGRSSASHMPVGPPIDRPQKCARSIRRCSSSSATSPPSCAKLYSPSGTDDLPWPRVS